jgi:Ca2+-binding EF-hand superfamily protein
MEFCLSKPAFLGLCALVLLAACGSSDDTPPRWNPYAAGPPREEIINGGPVAEMKKYDANGDGIVTRDEFLTRLRADFAAADTAKKGCLSDSQVLAINQKRIETDQSAASPLQDWNQDGCVNFQEFSAAPVSLYDQLDANGDGRITAQEFGPRGAGRGAPGAETGPSGRGGRGAPPPR